MTAVDVDAVDAARVAATGEEQIAQKLAGFLRPEGACLVFTGARSGGKYGSLRVGGRMVRAHRLAYELAHGPIPAGLVVMHVCDNPPCCRIEHLRAAPQVENVADMHAKGRANMKRPSNGTVQRSRTRCPQDHPYDDENTRWHRGKRYCRTCQMAANRRFRARRAAALRASNGQGATT